MTEGVLLGKLFHLAGIPNQLNVAIDHSTFSRALTDRLKIGIDVYNALPIVHFAGHGCEYGIQLTCQRDHDQIVTWEELAVHLRPIRQALGFLGVCMSTCNGLHAGVMAHVWKDADIPMNWVVGTPSSANYCDLSLAFALFYRGLQKGTPDLELFPAIQRATGIADFGIINGSIAQQQFQNASLERLLEMLRQNAQRQPAHPQPVQPQLARNPLLEAAQSLFQDAHHPQSSP